MIACFADQGGFNLIEVLITLAIMGIISSFMFPALMQFQDQGVKEISKNDLSDRAQRLSLYISRELSMAGFLLGRRPDPSIAMGPTPIVYDATIAVSNNDDDNDEITVLAAESFFPKLTATNTVTAGAVEVVSSIPQDFFTGVSSNADRRSLLGVRARDLDRLGQPVSFYANIAFENHKRAYPLDATNNLLNGLEIATPSSGSHALKFKLDASDSVRENLSAGSEILRVRARRFHQISSGGEEQLRVDDGVSDDILDRAVEGLQLRYLLEDGTWSDNPAHAEDIRIVRVSLLVRALKTQKGLNNTTDYSVQMGPTVSAGTYGPYNDRFPRLVISQDVEVKNYVAR